MAPAKDPNTSISKIEEQMPDEVNAFEDTKYVRSIETQNSENKKSNKEMVNSKSCSAKE